MKTLEDGLRIMVRTFRRECHRILESERTTIHGADGMLMLLQLAIAEVNKQECGEFSVILSDVLMAWKHLLLDKLHMPHDDSPPGNYDLIRQAYDSFLKRTNTVDLIDIHSMYNQLRVDPDPEEPLSTVQLLQFLSGKTENYEVRDFQVPSTPSNKSRPCSTQVRKVVRRVFCSYLDLLVNSKNDMALAHVLDTPSRSLGRTAFTDLKHEAHSKNMSLFLAVTSFVRAVQLGGKGYAPAESDPLRKHLKGLSEFVNFTDNLEELLGENPDASITGARLVSSMRAALVKGRSSEDVVYAAADETMKDLKQRISQLHLSLTQAANRTGISPARPRAHAVNHATAYGGRETVKLLMALLDEEALAPPCRNKADLLSEDKAVLNRAEGTCILTLFQSPEASTGTSPEPLKKRIQNGQDQLKPKARERVIRSQFACTYKDEELPLNRVLEFPSTSQVPTCVHPAPKRTLTPVVDQEDLEPEPTSVAEEPGTVEVNPESVRKERGGPIQGVALGQRCGNAPNRGAGTGTRKTGIQSGGKACKRKQVDGNEHSGSENQPPLKKPPTSAPSTSRMSGKNPAKALSKKKLIAGQGKLTSFFRL